ncbi:hypothetical protein HHL22_07175 [Hymenobacter sp. RP-2-7]|uniref:Uncharacterized protein n=1 Tax=Hymenobacter polaris TaxID=2682546 RepID=A0A7Y0ADB0_9BACT|nr:hypothetical protein [Hymenobacter polaris]NML64985.1 hypothetical protein [Hymenobacter polaris]
MKKTVYLDVLKLLPAVLVAGAIWLWVRQAATPDAYPAVAAALRQARPADLQSITVYPLLPGPLGGDVRPFQLRTMAALAPLLRALQQLRPVAISQAAPQPLLEATVVVRLQPALAAAWHLHSRDIIWRLATVGAQPVALRAHSSVVCQSAALSRQVRHLRDSLATGPARP